MLVFIEAVNETDLIVNSIHPTYFTPRKNCHFHFISKDIQCNARR